MRKSCHIISDCIIILTNISEQNYQPLKNGHLGRDIRFQFEEEGMCYLKLNGLIGNVC